jgi:hypothetical protein
VHHRTGLCDQQCEREEHAEPRGLPTAGQESGLCHASEYSLYDGTSGGSKKRVGHRGLSSHHFALSNNQENWP